MSSELQVETQGKPLPMSHTFLNLVFLPWFFIRRIYIQALGKQISISCSSMAFLVVFPVGFQSQVFGASSFPCRIRRLGHLMWSLDPWLLRESKCPFTLYYYRLCSSSFLVPLGGNFSTSGYRFVVSMGGG